MGKSESKTHTTDDVVMISKMGFALPTTIDPLPTQIDIVRKTHG